jgi:regulator of sigma E protease
MLNIFAFIFVFSILVFFHEFGHYIAAVKFGVKVYKFSLGFGPKIWRFTKNETEYSICLIPLGGFVRMAGETGQEEDKATLNKLSDEQRFDKKLPGIKAIIVALGPLMNIIISIVIFSIIFFANGVPMITNNISSVIENGPAYQAGVLPGDKIIAINSIKMDDPEKIAEIINKSSGERLKITLDRNEESIDIFLTPRYDEKYKKVMIGINFEMYVKKYNIFLSINKGIMTTGKIIKLIFSNTIEIITGKVPMEIAGPLGIAQMTGQAAKLGFLNLLYFTAVLSIFIGLFNLFPIPILDGGQIVIIILEKLRGKPLEANKMSLIYLIGISFMVLLFVFATYKDIVRLFFK